MSTARVAFVIDELDVGGTEQQILELVKRLDPGRYRSLVVCFRPGRIAREIETAGTRVVALKKRAPVDPVLVLSLARLLRRERVDLLQTYLFTANTWGRLAGVLARVPAMVSSERNVDMWEEAYKRGASLLLDRFTRCTIANSEAVGAYLVRKGLHPRKVRVIPNGVDPSRFDGPVTPHAIKTELGIPLHHAVVALVARVEPQKDPITFIEAAAMAAARRPAVSFLVVGGGSLADETAARARDLGIGERVVFTGPRRDVARLLAACDVSVNSSLKEGMSNTIMESMASGKPVVATRVGSNAELVVDGETGFVVRPRDAAGLANAVGRLLDDPALAKAMGLAARSRICRHYSVDAMVAATQSLFDGLVASAGQRAA
jgi:glycosyltransferase involved in cell wall biosynthesis